MLFINMLIRVTVSQLMKKTIKALWPMFYGITIIMVAWAAYKSFIWMLFWVLKRYLRNKNLDTFKKLLGKNYQAKSLGEGDKRYKWNKWIFSVKANFDNEGNLICNFIEPVKFWSFKSVLSFV